MTRPYEENGQDLRARLEEAEEMLRAIRSGEVDALVVAGNDGDRVFTLEGADHPYRVLIEAMQQGAASLSLDGTVLFCNRCFADMLETPHEKIVGARVTDFLSRDQTILFHELLQQGSARSAQGELEFQAAAGRRLPVYVALAPLLLTDTAALCMVVTDLTERKEHQDLQVANRRKDEFLAMLAHELRNPLAPIQNAVAVLQHLDLEDQKLTFSRNVIERQVQHLARLVDDLLDVSRISLGKIKLRREAVELDGVLNRALETIQPVIDARRQRLTLTLNSAGVRVDADPTRLAQVFGNLLANAAKYTDDEGRIDVETSLEGDTVTISVRDSGIGVAPELLPHIFDLFTQGDRSLARSEGGLGIGLTLVRRLVELHGGSVEARSDGLGSGSEFRVSLPRLPTPASARSGDRTRPEVPRNRSGLSVLVVDDHRDGANTLGMLLQLMGHQPRIEYSGAAGLEAAVEFRPDLVLLDIGLPGMSGYEVARSLRELEPLRSTVLVAMTGYGQEEDRARSREAGFDHHLVKPVELHVLKSLCESLLRPAADR